MSLCRKLHGPHGLLFPGAAPSLLLTFLLLLAPACSAREGVLSAGDATALVRRAVHQRLAASVTHHPLRFVLHKKDLRRDTTREVIETAQGDVAMLIAVNGAPLSEEGRQAEVARLDNLAAHPELQEHRRKREAEDAARAEKLLRLLPDAFLYADAGTAPCDVNRIPPVPGTAVAAQQLPGAEHQCQHLTFTPNPKFDPPDMEANILQGMAGEVWIEKSQERLVRLRARLISDVQFGWGFVGRLNRGGTVDLEQADVGGGDWEVTRMDLNMTGRAFLVKALDIRISQEQSGFAQVPRGTDYRKAIEMLKASAGQSLGGEK